MAFQVKLEQDYTPVGYLIPNVCYIQYVRYSLQHDDQRVAVRKVFIRRLILFLRMTMKTLFQIQSQIIPCQERPQKRQIPN